MVLSRLKPPKGAVKTSKRVGRGDGSGLGKTSGRGHKGYKSRSGGNVARGYEGGQMPIQRRVPKRGFKNRFRIEYTVVNVGALSCFEKEQTVDLQVLREKGLVKKNMPVKILGDGALNIPLTIKADKFSASAREKIEASNGKVEVI